MFQILGSKLNTKSEHETLKECLNVIKNNQLIAYQYKDNSLELLGVYVKNKITIIRE